MLTTNFFNKAPHSWGFMFLEYWLDFIMEFLVPISVMVFLNLFLIFRLLYLATRYVQSRDVRLSQFRIYEGEFPDRLRSARQQFQNMFEIPILFYLLCLLNIIFNNYNQLDIILCWCFVVFRVIHFFTRLPNQKTINIFPRTAVFIISLIFLTIGWISLLINSFVI